MSNSARTNLERRQYQQSEEAERQHAEHVVRQQQELESKPLRDAEAAYGTIASSQAEEFRNMIATTPLADDYLQSEGFILGEQKHEQFENAGYRFRISTPSFNPKDEAHKAAIVGFLNRNGVTFIVSNFSKAWALLLEWGIVEAFVPPAEAAAQPAEQPAPVANMLTVDLGAPLVTDPVTGTTYTERMLRLAPSTLELRLRRIIEHGHSGNEQVDEYRERQSIIAQKKATLNTEVPVHAGEEN